MAREEFQDDNAADELEPGTAPAAPLRARRGRRVRIALILGIAGVAMLGSAWVGRKQIADNLVERELASLGVPATYEIVRIAPDEQIVRNVVVGDPKRPDLTIAEVRIATQLHFGWPGLGRITLVRPRLYGSVRHGKVSFGHLDSVLFSDTSSEQAGLPDLDLAVVDGRALLETDAGPVGLSLDGAGGLRGGFKGELAAKASELSYGNCHAGAATIYGKLSVSGGQPRLVGPLRLADMACADQGIAVRKAGIQVDLTLDEALNGGTARLGLDSETLRMDGGRVAALTGTGEVTYRDGSLNARYDLKARDTALQALRLSQLTFSGTARTSIESSTFSVEGDLAGRNMRPGGELTRSLTRFSQQAKGTFAGALADKVRANLARQLQGSAFEARLVARKNARGRSLVVPQARVRGRSGDSLLELSRVQLLLTEGAPRLSGNFVTAGRGLPQMNGRMETLGSGGTALHVQMADYRSGDDHLQIPELILRQDRRGDLAVTGKVRLGGALPGGSVENLTMPIAARWQANGDLAMWSSCTTTTFDSLTLANLTLDRNQLALCPSPGAAIVQLRKGGLKLAAGTPSLALSGRLGDSEVRLKTGPVGMAYPGTISAQDVKVALGPESAPSRFEIANLDASLTGEDIGGSFRDGDIALSAVPLDMHQAAGSWHYRDGVLALEDSRFVLVDRQKTSRFKPMVSRGASLKLANNVITADALLREPESDRPVVRADIVHDLGTTNGHATLKVDDLVFDKKLQPDQLADSVKGLVSTLKGHVHGTGRIDWNVKGITSRGRFASDGLDFAAPFGPVQGLSGQVVFTDLLGMVTAPDQVLKVASINPGIEVNDGTLSFELKPDYRLVVNGAQWPFMQGKLTLEPTTMTVGAVETRHYTLKVDGLDAAALVRHMEMNNISASGVFDGELPIVFDEKGGHIENGTLTAREPGGNVAYVGALTYEDLSAMGNFAFDALKSVDYKTMQVVLNGSLSGEIITQIRFTGVSQGAGATRNFLTKQVARLPIRFVVNIKAPFFQLFGNMRSLYDSNYVVDPRTLGLVGKDGKTPGEVGKTAPFISIQPPVSEGTP